MHGLKSHTTKSKVKKCLVFATKKAARKLIIIILLFAATASASIFLNSFNSGLISEELKVRHDLDRTHMGSEVLDNILIRPQGMAYKRPGTECINTENSDEFRMAIGDLIN